MAFTISRITTPGFMKCAALRADTPESGLAAACAGAANHRRADTRETYAYRTCLPTWQTRLPKRYANIPSSRVLGIPANILPRKRRQPEIRTYIPGAPPNTALLRLSGQHGAASGA